MPKKLPKNKIDLKIIQSITTDYTVKPCKELYGEIARVPHTDKDNNKTYKLYFIDYGKKGKLGKGAAGEVYKVHPINETTGEIDYSKIIAVKVFNKAYPLDFVENNEAKNCAYIYATKKPFKANDKIYLFMQYLPGEELIHSKREKLNKKIAKASFLERIKIIKDILIVANNLHNNTPRTGKSKIHSDFKEENIKYHATEGSSQSYPLDFGLTLSVDEDALYSLEDMIGTVTHMAPEVIRHNEIGIRSDIYSLAAIIMLILGAKNPYSIRNLIFEILNPDVQERALKKIALKGFNFNGILENIEIPDLIIDIKPIIINFLKRMSDNEYYKRPTSGEALRFFLALHNLCLRYEANPLDRESQYQYLAQLTLLASGKWDTVLGQRTIEIYKSSNEIVALPSSDEIQIEDTNEVTKKSSAPLLEEVKGNEVDSTFEHFNFALEAKSNQLIINLYNQSQLTEYNLKQLPFLVTICDWRLVFAGKVAQLNKDDLILLIDDYEKFHAFLELNPKEAMLFCEQFYNYLGIELPLDKTEYYMQDLVQGLPKNKEQLTFLLGLKKNSENQEQSNTISISESLNQKYKINRDIEKLKIFCNNHQKHYKSFFSKFSDNKGKSNIIAELSSILYFTKDEYGSFAKNSQNVLDKFKTKYKVYEKELCERKEYGFIRFVKWLLFPVSMYVADFGRNTYLFDKPNGKVFSEQVNTIIEPTNRTQLRNGKS